MHALDPAMLIELTTDRARVTCPARARGSPPRFRREHLDRSDETSVGRAEATNRRGRTRDHNNRRV
jgi:hypothetical protein